MSGKIVSMDGRTAGTNRYGTERGTDFWYEILFGTVRGTDFGTKFYLVRYVVRISVRIFIGTERGPEFGTKIRSGTDNPYRYGFWYGFTMLKNLEFEYDHKNRIFIYS